MIEKYRYEGDGYVPFLIRENWQVAQLNFVQGQGADDIRLIEYHANTDEVFILIAGRGILITANKDNDEVTFDMHLMKKGIVYNVPKGVWHNVVMEKDTEIFIVEDANTHVKDCNYYSLNDAQKRVLYDQVACVLNQK